VQNCCCSSINDFANGTTVAEWSIVAGCDIYNLYRYNWAADAQTSSDEEGFLDQKLCPRLCSLLPLIFSHSINSALGLILHRWRNHIPVSLVNLLKGKFMSKPERQHPYNFGRVFFQRRISQFQTGVFSALEIMLATLYVSSELESWWFSRTTPSERQESFQRVLKAAKPMTWVSQKFNIEVKTTAKGKFKDIYSFRGHRF